MRALLPLALLASLALAGCDTINGTDSGAAALMERLDGTWSRTVTTERIAPDGSVTPEGTARTDAYEIGRRIRCNRIELTNAGDADRIAVQFDPTDPASSRNCDVITTDGDARRLIFVGDNGSILQDRVATIEEDTASRQVWAFYAFDGADAIRTLWTLTR